MFLALQKPNRLSLVEQVAAQLESLIESGQWYVGMRIPAEPELVAELGVSRNTLREAIRALVHAGLLATKQGDGTYVCSASALGAVLKRRIRQSNILETLEVRYALEREAACLAAARRTEEDIEAMRSHLLVCDTAMKSGDLQAYTESDIRLHQAIVQAAHNSVLIELYEHMTEALHLSINSQSECTLHLETHQNIHQKLVEAIVEKNAAEAMEAVHEYIKKVKGEIQLELEEES
jgi:DNA-binding FadR family transcriptional regulator